MTTQTKVASNLIQKYGQDDFLRLIERFKANDNNQKIADDFGVSRERVRQWKHTLGRTFTFFEVDPDVKALLREQRD